MSLWYCSEHGVQGPSKWNMCPTCGRGMSRAEVSSSLAAAQATVRTTNTDSAEILTSERSTSDRPRDPVRPSSSSVPSARTVTRYWMWAAPNDQADQFEVYKVTEIDPLLTTLADKETAIATLKAAMELDAEDFERAVKVSHEQTDQITGLTARAEAAAAGAEEARMGHVRLDECSDMVNTGHLKLYERIGLKLQKNYEQRAAIEARYPNLPSDVNEWLAGIARDREQLQVAEAKVIDTEAKCGHEIINLRTQLVAAEATLATLRDAANVALSFLRHLTDDAKGLAGATAERTLLAATAGKP